MFRHLLVHASEHPSLAQGQAPPGLLSPVEEQILAGLVFPQRRRKWLLGRMAAKRLLAEMGWGADVTILNDQAGAPYAQKAGKRLPVCVSISHRGDWGLAAVGEAPGVLLGADLETVEERDAAFKETLVIVHRKLDSGSQFSEAIREHPAHFSPCIVELVRTAEKSGAWDEILVEIADGLSDGTFE